MHPTTTIRFGASHQVRVAARESGFTLIEISIAVAILALAAAVVLPAVSNVSLAELRKSAGQVSGLVRSTYDKAALSGERYRIVFSPGTGAIKVERGSSPGGGGSGLLGLAAMAMGGGLPGAQEDSDDDDVAVDVQPPAEIIALFGGTLADGTAATTDGLSSFSAEGAGLDFGDEVKVMDVWVEGMSQPSSDGTVYLTFFPHGYTESALIHLTDLEGRVFTVEVKALTGTTEIFAEYIEARR
jgi:general secretion pathway protein H